ncbi:MAG: GNAT family N-acetyltransferase [Xanthomonadales bacterium]|nr:GNAT family N-acetyltransferase [Xanthomonadales bacterium]
MATLPTLEGTRIVLRHPRGTDLADLYALFSSAEVTRYWSHGPWHARHQAESYLRDIHAGAASGQLLQWAITLKGEDRLIGTVTLFAFAREHARCEIGFALHPGHWGQGLAHDAVSTALHHAIHGLRIERVEADADPNNAASLRLLEALGFQREGYARERYRLGGGAQDSVLLGLLARELACHVEQRRARSERQK